MPCRGEWACLIVNRPGWPSGLVGEFLTLPSGWSSRPASNGNGKNRTRSYLKGWTETANLQYKKCNFLRMLRNTYGILTGERNSYVLLQRSTDTVTDKWKCNAGNEALLSIFADEWWYMRKCGIRKVIRGTDALETWWGLGLGLGLGLESFRSVIPHITFRIPHAEFPHMRNFRICGISRPIHLLSRAQ